MAMRLTLVAYGLTKSVNRSADTGFIGLPPTEFPLILELALTPVFVIQVIFDLVLSVEVTMGIAMATEGNLHEANIFFDLKFWQASVELDLEPRRSR